MQPPRRLGGLTQVGTWHGILFDPNELLVLELARESVFTFPRALASDLELSRSCVSPRQRQFPAIALKDKWGGQCNGLEVVVAVVDALDALIVVLENRLGDMRFNRRNLAQTGVVCIDLQFGEFAFLGSAGQHFGPIGRVDANSEGVGRAHEWLPFR